MSKMEGINKYVRWPNGMFVVFPNEPGRAYPSHKEMAKVYPLSPMSAGQIMMDGDIVTCSGESTTLDLKPAADDEAFFRKVLMI